MPARPQQVVEESHGSCPAPPGACQVGTRTCPRLHPSVAAWWHANLYLPQHARATAHRDTLTAVPTAWMSGGWNAGLWGEAGTLPYSCGQG